MYAKYDSYYDTTSPTMAHDLEGFDNIQYWVP